MSQLIHTAFRTRTATRRTAGRGFTLVEILIVVVILGILAAMAVPKFSNASQTAREGTLKDEMRYMRTQITVYSSQHHDVLPGFPNGDKTQTATAAAFMAQLTQHTDEFGNVSATEGGVYTFGPYLTQMPPNPVNGQSTVEIVPDGPITADGTTGWIFQPGTGAFAPNLAGTDSQGQIYVQY